MHSLISFKSYTVSCITNLDNSVHPFHPSSPFSSHTPYQSAFRMLCYTIHASFSTKNAHSHASFFNSSHVFDSLRSASMRLSDDCFLSVHPFLITLLLNQLLQRNHTTVLRFHSYFWICWSELSRDASLAINRYLHRFHQENGLLITR